MPQYSQPRMHLLVIPALGIDAVDAKNLQLATINLRRKDGDHASVFVIEKSAFGCRKDQQRHASLSENQQIHLTIEFAAVPFVVFAIHWRASRVSYTALPKIEAVDQDFKAEGTLPYDVIRTMRMLTEEDVRQKLDPVRLIAALESAFRDRYPSTEIPLRTHINLDSGIFLLMPCYDRARDALGMKLVTVQETPAHPEERIQATYILFDSQTASPKLIVPANYLTDLRTAATSAVATKFLARETAATLGIFGTGRQARAHLRVLPLVRNFQRVLVCGRTRAATESFVKELSGDIAIAPANAATVAAESDVICTCTTSSVPLFDGNLIRSGTHLNLVGSFQPHTREVDTITVQRYRIFVDTYDGCLAEAGDLLIPMKEGAIPRDRIAADLHELVTNKKLGRSVADQITLFKSVGCALEDLVAAELLL